MLFIWIYTCGQVDQTDVVTTDRREQKRRRNSSASKRIKGRKLITNVKVKNGSERHLVENENKIDNAKEIDDGW